YLRFLLDKVRPDEETAVAEWTRELVDSLLVELNATEERGPRSFPIGRIPPIFLIAAATKRYRRAFTDEGRITIVRRIIEASSNPGIFTHTKADVFVGLADMIVGIDPDALASVRELLADRDPANEQAGIFDAPG